MTAVSVAPEYRKQGLARLLMNYLERVSDSENGFFVDLFVRSTNKVAIEMYEKMGYSLYRVVNKYYSSSQDSSAEDAFGIASLTQICGSPSRETLKASLPNPQASGSNPTNLSFIDSPTHLFIPHLLYCLYKSQYGSAYTN